MIDLPRPIAVVCHDAGATNLILPWLDGQRDVLPVMQGPAATLWERRFGEAMTLSFDQAMEDAGSLLSGTGWASDLEHRARKVARQRGMQSVAVIDHWVNYPERFERAGEQVLPDEIRVTDEDAVAIARRSFPAISIRKMPNLYLEEQVEQAPTLHPDDEGVLFVAEPARSDWGRDRPGEFQALDYFIERRASAGIPDGAPMRLRPHPSDPAGKYDGWLLAHGGIVLDYSADLAAALDGARWVVGLETYGLVIALHAGREAISAVPPWAPACRLPQREIVRLSDL